MKANYTDFATSFGEADSTIEALQSAPVLNDLAGDPPDEDIYILLQGPAHIKPLNGTSVGIEVTFLDDTGKPVKTPINFNFNNSLDPPFTALKVMTLQIMVECKKTEFEEAERQGIAQAYLPKLYEKVFRTEINEQHMNPPDPPFPNSNK